MLCKDAEAKKLAIGLMSGTSADGIDAVLVEISGCSTNTHVRQMAFVTLPFTDAVRSRILQVAAGNFGGSEELCLMNFFAGQAQRRRLPGSLRAGGRGPAECCLCG